MGYIELTPDLPDTSKAVISLWFRVPQQSIIHAREQYKAYINGDDPRRPLIGIIPLMVFGEPNLKQRGYDLTGVKDIGGYPADIVYVYDFGVGDYVAQPIGPGLTDSTAEGNYQVSFPEPNAKFFIIEPSYIGVDCTGDDPDKDPVLSVNINFPKGNHPKGDGLFAIGTSTNGGRTSSYTSPGPALTGDYGPNHFCVLPYLGGAYTITSIIGDTSYADVFLGGMVEQIKVGGDHPITADHWHHLLLSFDLSKKIRADSGQGFQTNDETIFPGTSSTSGDTNDSAARTPGNRTENAGKVWLSLDDESLTKKALSQYYPTESDEQNAVLPVRGYEIAASSAISSTSFGPDCHGNVGTVNTTIPKIQYILTPQPIPMRTIGLPATEHYVDSILNVEMALLQIFTDVTLDTNKEPNRRAFISDVGRPASPGAAKTLLGKRPELALNSVSNWKKARNSGTLGDKPKQSGVHVGNIKTYNPSPSLYGPQSPKS